MLIYTGQQVTDETGAVLTEKQREQIDWACDWLKTEAGVQYIVDRAQREEMKLLRLLED